LECRLPGDAVAVGPLPVVVGVVVVGVVEVVEVEVVVGRVVVEVVVGPPSRHLINWSGVVTMCRFRYDALGIPVVEVDAGQASVTC